MFTFVVMHTYEEHSSSFSGITPYGLQSRHRETLQVPKIGTKINEKF
jgi:hypothetical protein